MIKIRKGFDLNEPLRLLAKARKLRSDGSLVLNDFFTLEELKSYFATAIIVDGETEAFVYKAIEMAIVQEQAPDVQAFNRHLHSAVSVLKTKKKLMRAVFPVWGIQGILNGRRRSGGVTIDFDPSKKSFGIVC